MKMFRMAALALLLASPAAAHVTIDPPEAPAGAFQRIALRVPHGCAGQPTTAIEVALPEGIAVARPMPKPGWEIAIETRPLARPLPSAHGMVREAPSAIAWRGGSLADAHYDEFVLMIRTPEAPGTTLLFPVVQRCAVGEHRWVEVPDAANPRPRSPIATLRLGEARR